MWRCRHKKPGDEPRRHNDIMSPRLVQIAAQGNYLVIIIIGGWGRAEEPTTTRSNIIHNYNWMSPHSLSCYKASLWWLYIKSSLSCSHSHQQPLAELCRHLTMQCQTPRVKTTAQASIDVMGHNNMTIMSLTTTHAVPGGLLLTPIMWRVLCCHENIATDW